MSEREIVIELANQSRESAYRNKNPQQIVPSGRSQASAFSPGDNEFRIATFRKLDDVRSSLFGFEIQGHDSIAANPDVNVDRQAGAKPSKNRSTDLHQLESSTGSTFVSLWFFSSTPISQRIGTPLAAFAWPARRAAALRGSSHEDLSSIRESSIGCFAKTATTVSRVKSSISCAFTGTSKT
jgi:hypothetical protein